MNVEKKRKIFLCSQLPIGTYHKNLAIWKLFVLEIWRFLAIFSMENTLYKLKSYFSGRNLAKISPKKKNTGLVQHWSNSHITSLLKSDYKPLIHFSPSLFLVEKPLLLWPQKTKMVTVVPGQL